MNVLDQHVKLAWNDVHGHALICNQDVVRDVCFDKVVEDDTCCMSQCFLGVFQLGVVVFDLWRQKQCLHRPADYFTESDSAAKHVDLLGVLVL